MRTSIQRRLRLASAFALGLALTVGLVISGRAGAAVTAPTTVYDYDIVHAEHGTIGRYVNEISSNGEVTRIRNRARVRISLFGIPVYKMVAERVETWSDGRLVAYSGVTDDNGSKMRVQGRREGESFVIDGKDGQTVAPGDILPTNPWNAAFSRAEVLMRAETGKVEEVRVEEVGHTMVEAGGRRLAARHYRVLGTRQYDVWLDRRGVPVRFEVEKKGDRVAFILRDG